MTMTLDLGLTLAVVFIPLLLYWNAQEKRQHIERMKRLEIARLEQEARNTTWRTLEELAK